MTELESILPLIVVGAVVIYMVMKKKKDQEVSVDKPEPVVKPKPVVEVEKKPEPVVKPKPTVKVEKKPEPVVKPKPAVKVEKKPEPVVKSEPKQTLTPPSWWKPGMDIHTGEAFSEYDPSVKIEGSGVAPHIGGGLSIKDATKVADNQLKLMEKCGAGKAELQDLLDLSQFLIGTAEIPTSITLSNGHTITKSQDVFGNISTEWKRDGKTLHLDPKDKWREEIKKRTGK